MVGARVSGIELVHRVKDRDHVSGVTGLETQLGALEESLDALLLALLGIALKWPPRTSRPPPDASSSILRQFLVSLAPSVNEGTVGPDFEGLEGERDEVMKRQDLSRGPQLVHGLPRVSALELEYPRIDLPVHLRDLGDRPPGPGDLEIPKPRANL